MLNVCTLSTWLVNNNERTVNEALPICCILLVKNFFLTFFDWWSYICAVLHRYISNNISGARKNVFSSVLLLNTGIIHFVTSSKMSKFVCEMTSYLLRLYLCNLFCVRQSPKDWSGVLWFQPILRQGHVVLPAQGVSDRWVGVFGMLFHCWTLCCLLCVQKLHYKCGHYFSSQHSFK